MPATDFQTPLGRWSIAWNDEGLVTQLRMQPSGTTDGPSDSIARFLESLVAFLAGAAAQLGPLPPICLRHQTPFRCAVYAALQRVPAGSTTTYRHLAHAAGSPGASRAVGLAMARNPIPIIVPCHRVLGSDGSLTGFAGGLELKRRLLTLEGARLF